MSVSDKIRQKSAAEFFCEHQQIAGFDNPGKSLFTSIRELVENSLDATEIIHKLPNINVKVIEYNEQEHNKLHGIKQKEKKSEKLEESVVDVASVAPDGSTSDPSASTIATPTNTPAKGSKGKDKVVKDAARMYYKIIVEDNGCGMACYRARNTVSNKREVNLVSGLKWPLFGVKRAVDCLLKSHQLSMSLVVCRVSSRFVGFQLDYNILYFIILYFFPQWLLFL